MTFVVYRGGDQLAGVRARANAVEQLCTALAREVTALAADVTELVERPVASPLSVSVDEAARLLGVSRSTMFVLLDSGRIRSVKVGARRLVPRKALDEFLTEQDTQATG